MNVHRTERMESKGASENAVRVGGKERVNPNVLIYTYVGGGEERGHKQSS